jgi:hypothetical protein
MLKVYYDYCMDTSCFSILGNGLKILIRIILLFICMLIIIRGSSSLHIHFGKVSVSVVVHL